MIIKKTPLIIGICLMIDSLIKLLDYKTTGCMITWFTPQVCGEEANTYIYLYAGELILGIVLFIASFGKKCRKEEKVNQNQNQVE